MKKYFVKYLPVEGAIKKGDKHICLSNGLICDTSEDLVFYVNNEHHRKVQLFLCSRDFTYGDNVMNFATLEKNVVSDMGFEDGNWFKVIGPISPQALWVKEGDEFDEDEIRHHTMLDDTLIHIKIKCSNCETFH